MGQEPPAEVVNLSIEERGRPALLGPDGAGRTSTDLSRVTRGGCRSVATRPMCIARIKLRKSLIYLVSPVGIEPTTT